MQVPSQIPEQHSEPVEHGVPPGRQDAAAAGVGAAMVVTNGTNITAAAVTEIRFSKSRRET